jgi:uncharacterized protein (DUF486 family)
MHTILLLTVSNIFMTFAWYGHLKYKYSPLWIVILVSWGIASFEYCFQVPANRIGHYLGDFLRVLGCLFEGRAEMELSGRVWSDGWSSVSYL